MRGHAGCYLFDRSSLKCDARKCCGDWNDAQLCHWCLFCDVSATPAVAAPILWTGNGHYYEFIGESRTWSSALCAPANCRSIRRCRRACAVQGHLVTITSAKEQAFRNQHFGNSGWYWIAAGDAAVEGTWRWNAGPENGSLLTFTNWRPGEPNNGVGFFEEDQAVANYNGIGLWNDWVGFVSTNFIVEYVPASPAVATPEPTSIGLLLTGLAGVALRRRRARS